MQVGDEYIVVVKRTRPATRPVDPQRAPRVINDRGPIVYDAGRTLWVNRPRSGAESLDDDDILVTNLYGGGSSLCSIDIVRLHDRTSFFYSGFVGLGEFVPYRKVAAVN